MRSAFALKPQGLLVQEEDGQQKLVVPTFMWQKVMASCYDEPTKEHPGVYRTRDGHGIPKCSLCPSVFFLYPRVRLSISVFFGGVASTYVRHPDR